MQKVHATGPRSIMTRQQRIYLAQSARSQAYDALWEAMLTKAEFCMYNARTRKRKFY